MASPSRRLPGPGGGTTKTVLTFWAFLLLIAATHSQSQDVIQTPKSSYASTGTNLLPSSKSQPGRSPSEIPGFKLDTTTLKARSTEHENTNADKYYALAPAPDAVRAPLAPSGASLGRSSLPSARQLQDWEVENIVLLATIDGAIHARDRKTGQERWSLAVPDSPMIETTHQRQNRSNVDEAHPEDDYIFIVEPSKDGDLYIQYNDPIKGLQRLGITVRSLASQTPQYVDSPPLVTTAQTESTLYMVDAASGNVLKQFNKHRTFVNDNQDRSCRRISGFGVDDEECEPFGTLSIGRNQYTVTIASAVTGDNLCVIKYSEWTPNTRDVDLQGQHVEPLDSCHIQSYHNGRIIGLDKSKDFTKPYRFTHVLESPVARVYDVFRPLDNKDGSASLVMLSQPIDYPYPSQSHPWNDEVTRSRVFVNQTVTGDWYALSELSYPGVTSHAAPANIFREFTKEREYLDFDEDIDDIIGVHVLSLGQNNMEMRLTISGSSSESENAEGPASGLVPINPSQPPAMIPKPNLDLKFLIVTMLLGVVSFTFLLNKRHSLALKIQKILQKAGITVAIETKPPTEEAFSPAPQQQASTESPESPVELEPVAQALSNVSDMSEEFQIITPLRSRTHSSSQGLTAKKLTKLDDGNDNSSDGESDDEGGKPNDQADGIDDGAAQPKRRKAKRGKRGGKNNRKKKQMSPDALDENETMIVSEVPTKDAMLQVGRLKINTNYDQCLGHGSNGTAVFPGILDGREVAVKRLLRSSTSLAAKEIKHLLSSDENPHVIRYFGKEESQNFTYIALDLFTASLDQVIEHPDRYPSLVAMPVGFDIKDALRQILDGVQHLHSLKLVHRDIKPQNVLVRAVKSSRPIEGLPRLQFVISDFGLCKPLEEGPESTFAPTANHTAAGTTGWRAPELLVNSRAAVAAPSATSSASKSNSHSSDGTVIDPPSGRRATKAIDIFSLGCVFYYVMTQGNHPFDVGGTSLGRDLNIKENKFTTDGLKLHAYEFDAEDLIMQMISHNPKDRPDTQTILRHPYFWDVADKLDFLCDLSDCYEREKNGLSSSANDDVSRSPSDQWSLSELRALESLTDNVIGPSRDFMRALPRSFIAEMGKQRKYTGSKMIDLLRVIRNKKNHFHDLPDDVKDQMLGGSIVGYYGFWAKRFPSLVINCHCLVLERGLVGRWRLDRYFA